MIEGCDWSPLGLENGEIPDTAIAISGGSYPERLRLNTQPYGWRSNVQSYVDIDLGRSYLVTKMATQSDSHSGSYYVVTYSLSFSLRRNEWKPHTVNGVTKVIRKDHLQSFDCTVPHTDCRYAGHVFIVYSDH